MTPQKLDSFVRTVTTSALALGLVGALIARAVTIGASATPGYLDLVIVTLASSIVSFYMGGHVAQNTAAVEETRQREATKSAQASADRSEASAVRADAADPTTPTKGTP